MAGDNGDADTKLAMMQHFHILGNQLWQRLSRLIGIANGMVFLQTALLHPGQQYPFLQYVLIDESGIHVDALAKALDTVEPAVLRAGLYAYVDAVMIPLTEIVGEVLTHKIAPLVHQFKHHIEA